jgi:hypothetical protein
MATDKPQTNQSYKRYRRVNLVAPSHFDEWYTGGSQAGAFWQVYQKDNHQSHVHAITRQGDTLFIVAHARADRNRPGECIEVPWANVACATALTEQDILDLDEHKRVLSDTERRKLAAGPQPETPYEAPPRLSIAFQGAAA